MLGLRTKGSGGIWLDMIWQNTNHLNCIIGMSTIGNLHTQHVTGKIFNIIPTELKIWTNKKQKLVQQLCAAMMS